MTMTTERNTMDAFTNDAQVTGRPLRDVIWQCGTGKGKFGREFADTLLRFLFMRHGSITLHLPDAEDLDKQLYAVHEGKQRGILMGANLNGYVGGVYFTWNSEKEEWTVSTHT